MRGGAARRRRNQFRLRDLPGHLGIVNLLKGSGGEDVGLPLKFPADISEYQSEQAQRRR